MRTPPLNGRGSLEWWRRVAEILGGTSDRAHMRQWLSGIDRPDLAEGDRVLSALVREAWLAGTTGDESRTGWARAALYVAVRALVADCAKFGVSEAVADIERLPIFRNHALTVLLLPATENLGERARLCVAALRDLRFASEPELWMAVQRECGAALLQDQGPGRAERLEAAREHYERAIAAWDASALPKSTDWAQAVHELGMVYRRRVRGDRAGNLQHALSLYEQALTVRTRDAHPTLWAETKHDIGLVRLAQLGLPGADRLEYGERAIESFEAARQVRDLHDTVVRWAESSNDLANALVGSWTPGEGENLEEAIQICGGVLTRLATSSETTDSRLIRARTHITRGTAYQVRMQGGRLDNLDLALRDYENALSKLDADREPDDWARAVTNVARTHRAHPSRHRTEHLQAAIQHFRRALERHSRADYPREWASIQLSLGNALCQPGLPDRASSLERAIECYESALEVLTQDTDAESWSTVQNNLGNAYSERLRGRPADNRSRAMRHYEAALRVRGRDRSSLQWAETQNNIGVLLVEAHGEDTTARAKAAKCLSDAAKAQSPAVWPDHARRAGMNLGRILLEDGDWRGAEQALAVAIEATEYLYGEAVTEVGRQAELAASPHLFSDRAYALAKLGDPTGAAVCLESGRARMVAEGLWHRQSLPQSVSETVRSEIEDLTNKIDVLDAERFRRDDLGGADGEPVASLLAARRAELRRKLDDLGITPPRPDLKAISAAVLPGRPLVYVAATPVGGVCLVLEQGADPSAADLSHIWLPQCTRQAVARLVADCYPHLVHDVDDVVDDADGRGGAEENGMPASASADDGTGSGPREQRAVDRLAKESWRRVLTKLWPFLTDPDRARSHAQVTLVPTGLLGLLPFHAAWHERDGKRAYPADDLPILYAPSAAVMASAQRLASGASAEQLSAVEPPSPVTEAGQLIGAHWEVALAAARFRDTTTIAGDEATIAKVSDAITRSDVVHLACHGEVTTDHFDTGLHLSYGQRLRLPDLLGLSARGRLCVLSACSSGVSGLDVPDEVVSLPGAFLRMGYAAAIASLWPADDFATLMLMDRFYSLWRDDPAMAPAAAFRRAQQWVRDTTAAQKASYYEERARELQREHSDAPGLADVYRSMAEVVTSPPPAAPPLEHPYCWGAFQYVGA